ncbi:hypothetical protein Tco_1299866 [Tanacetum coccineum]
MQVLLIIRDFESLCSSSLAFRRLREKHGDLLPCGPGGRSRKVLLIIRDFESLCSSSLAFRRLRGKHGDLLPCGPEGRSRKVDISLGWWPSLKLLPAMHLLTDAYIYIHIRGAWIWEFVLLRLFVSNARRQYASALHRYSSVHWPNALAMLRNASARPIASARNGYLRKGQKRSQKRQNRAQERKERERKVKSKPKDKKSKSKTEPIPKKKLIGQPTTKPSPLNHTPLHIGHFHAGNPLKPHSTMEQDKFSMAMINGIGLQANLMAKMKA